MPNHCYNILTVGGPNQDEVMDKIGKTFDFDQFIPYPKSLAERDNDREKIDKENDLEKRKQMEKKFIEKWGNENDGFNSGGYEWCIGNWGTKWNSYDQSRDDTYKISFNTAWSPPIPVVEALSKAFPKCEFTHEYFESGVGFCGSYIIKNGEKTDEKYDDKYDGELGG